MSTEAQCEMDKTCRAQVTHVDRDGYVYCTAHSVARRTWKACRVMSHVEIHRLFHLGERPRYERAKRAKCLRRSARPITWPIASPKPTAAPT